MVKDRTAHFSPTGDSMCNVCGETKETQMHFLFECDEAVIFWAQICSIFPKMQSRNIEEMMWFKQDPHFEKDEKQSDEAVAEALFLRWKERCKATMQAKYRYSSTKMWEDWAHAMKLRFQGRWHLAPEGLHPMPTLPPRPIWWRALPKPIAKCSAPLMPPVISLTELMPQQAVNNAEPLGVNDTPLHANFW